MNYDGSKESSTGSELRLRHAAKSWTACEFSNDTILGSSQRAEQRE